MPGAEDPTAAPLRSCPAEPLSCLDTPLYPRGDLVLLVYSAHCMEARVGLPSGAAGMGSQAQRQVVTER